MPAKTKALDGTLLGKHHAMRRFGLLRLAGTDQCQFRFVPCIENLVIRERAGLRFDDRGDLGNELGRAIWLREKRRPPSLRP